MTQIICSWLNDELKVSQFIDESNFSSAFCNGYLIGEILRKYDLMDNFDKLSRKSSTEAKLNNFILLEPILKLLGLPFNNSIARDIMESKFSVLINLMYQLFIALENKKKSNNTALSIQTMQAPATTRIQEIETVLYQQRLKKTTPRQSDLDLKDLIKKYQDHQQHMQIKAERDRILSAEGHKENTEKHRQNCLNRSKLLREEENEKRKKIEAAIVKIPKPPPNKTIEVIQRNKKIKNQKEAEVSLKELDDFDKRQRNIIVRDKIEDGLSISREESFSLSDGGVMDDTSFQKGKSIEKTEDMLEYIQPQNNKEYINRIRARLESDHEARIAREKRRRKVLINCLKSHYQQDEIERENMIAMRLMRQSQMERRIAVQLLQSRHEKNVIKSNRLERETQYQERREKEFINALEKERELIEQLKLLNMDNLKAEQELYDQKKAQNKLLKYQKHYQMAEKIVLSIIDLSCKVSEFKALTDGNIPPKLIREWKLSFINGVPVYDETEETDDVENAGSNEPNVVVIQDISVPIDRQTLNKDEMQKKSELLDEEDMMEYKQLIGEWQIDEESTGPLDRRNNILDWVIDRLQVLSNPVDENDKMPILPNFPIKAAVVGKCFSGKSMLIKNLIKNNRCVSIIPQNVIGEAIQAFKYNETIEVEVVVPVKSSENILNDNSKIDEDKTENQVADINLNSSLNDIGNISEMNDQDLSAKIGENLKEVVEIQKIPSPRAVIGGKIQEELMNGRSVNDQLLVEAIIENIKRIPEGSGWIIDDFPASYQQAKLFEKEATGYEEANVKPNQKKNRKISVVNRECAIDALILLNTSDRECLSRAMTCSENQLNNPSDTTNISNDVLANLQTSLTNFAEHWPKLSKFYNRLNNKLIRVVNSDQNISPTEVYLQVEIILDEIVKQKIKPEPLVEVLELPSVEIIAPIENPIPEDVISAPKEVISSKKSSGRKSKSSSRASSAGSKSSDKKATSRKSRSKSKSDSVNSKTDKKQTNKDTSKKKDVNSIKRKDSKGSKGSRDSKGSKGSKSSSKGSRTGSGRRKKSKVSLNTENEKAENPILPETVEPQPGDIDWVYCDKPINQEFSTAFYSFWESLNDVYNGNCKQTFRDMRYNREEIIYYLYAIRTAFRKFLDRPDAKQEYLDQFQKDFNDITEEWREDEEVQQELHQRISELKEQLLEISQENQVEAEKEMENIKNNRWIEDQVGLVTNQYLNLMQCEFDRFQDVVRFLKDYYKSMINPQLEEFKPEFLRLPLIEIPTDREETTDQTDANAEGVKQALTNTANPNPVSKKGAAKPAGKPQANENQGQEDTKELTEEEIEAMFKTKIPLIDYKAPGQQITSAIMTSIPASGKQAKVDKSNSGGGIAKIIVGLKTDKKVEKQLENLIPSSDLDEKLLYDALCSCYTLVNAMIELEVSLIGQKDEVDKGPANAAVDKGKTDKKGKGGKKSRTPTPKKGGKDKTATNNSAKSRPRSGSAKKKGKGNDKNGPVKETVDLPQPNSEESEEEKKNKLLIEKARMEYIAVLQKEAAILRTNVRIVMNKGVEAIKIIKAKIDGTFEAFSAWIADKLLKEDISIRQIEDLFRFHVENKTAIKEKLEIINHEFYLIPNISMVPDEVVEAGKKLPLEIRPSPIDSVDENYFTISQLRTFYHLFESITNSEDSSISIIDFVQLVNESIMASDQKKLPNFISQCNHLESSVTSVAEAFSCDKEYVNWRLFLLACSEPWLWPSQIDLLNMLSQFKGLDQNNTGFVTKEQYDFIDLWFDIPTTPSTPIDITVPKKVNRKSEVKKLFFDIFKSGKFVSESVESDTITQVEYMNYENMLLHFAVFCTANFYSGIIRALSVVTGSNLPHIPVTFKDIDLPAEEEEEHIVETDENFMIRIQDIYKVLSFGRRKTSNFDNGLENVDLEDTECERDTTLIKSLKNIYQSVQEEDELVTNLSTLLKHEELLEWFTSCQWFKYIDLPSFFLDANDTLRIPSEL